MAAFPGAMRKEFKKKAVITCRMVVTSIRRHCSPVTRHGSYKIGKRT